MADLTATLRRSMHVKLLRYACGRQMFCQCGRCLDYRRAVLVGASVLCGPCYDGIAAKVREAKGDAHVEAWEAANAENSDFIDGRRV